MAQAQPLHDYLILSPRQFGWATYINLLIADSVAKQGYAGIDTTQKEVEDDTPKQEEWRKRGMEFAAQLAGAIKTPDYTTLLKELDSTIKAVQTDAGREAKLAEMGGKIPRGLGQTDKDEILQLFAEELKHLSLSERSATIPDAATYVDGLAKEKTAGNPQAGPLVLPSLLFLGPSAAKLLGIRIEVYVLVSDTEAILYTTFGETGSITRFVLRTENFAEAMFPRSEILAAGVKLTDPAESILQEVQRLQNQAAKKTAAEAAAAQGVKKPGLTGQVSAKARQALAAAKRRMKLGAAFEGEVTVGHERVRLNEEDFDPARHTDVISFTQKYMTGVTSANDIVDAAELFSRLFAKGSEFVPDAPVPPCSQRERTLLYRALNARMMALRNEIRQLNRISPGNVDLLARANQHEFIKTLIDRMKAKEPQCATYGKEGAVSTEELQKAVDEETEVNEILRKFAVLVLHMKQPLQGMKYDPLTEPAQKIVNAVLEVPFDGSELEPYGKRWEQSFGRLIPGLLRAVVLDEKSAARLELETFARQELETLRNSLWELLDKDTTISAGAWPIVKVGLRAEPDMKVQVINTLKWVVQQVVKTQGAVGTAEAGAGAAAAAAASTSALVVEQRAQLVALENKVKELEEAIAAAGESATKDKATIEAKDTELAQIRAQVEEAKTQFAAVTAREEAAKAALKDANTSLTKAKAAAAAAAANAAACGSQLAEARTARTTADTEVRHIQGQITGLQAELQRLRSGAPAGAAEAATATAAAAKAESQLAALQAALQKAEAAAATAADEKRVAEAAKVGAEKEKGDAEATMREVRADAERTSAELQAQMVRLQDTIAAKDGEITRIQGELTNIRMETGGAQRASAGQAARISMLMRQIALLTSEKGDLIKELETTKEQASAAGAAGAGVAAAATEKTQLETELAQERERATKLAESIKALAESVAKGEPKVPTGVVPEVTTSFEELVKNITGLKATGDRPTMSPSLQLCYLQYFVLFFYKLLFFSTLNEASKEKTFVFLRRLNQKVDAAVNEMQGRYGGEIEAMEAMLEVGFDALEAAEGFMLGVITGEPGYHFIKNERWTAANPTIEEREWSQKSTLYNDAFYTIYKQFDADGGIPPFVDLEIGVTTKLTSGIPLQELGEVHFRPRFKLASDVVESNSFYAGKYPCFIYRPRTSALVTIPTDRTSLVNLMDGASIQTDMIPADTVGQWRPILAAKVSGRKLSYTSLFSFFIVLAFRYLRAKQRDLGQAGCPVPQQFLDLQAPAGTSELPPEAPGARLVRYPPPPPPGRPAAAGRAAGQLGIAVGAAAGAAAQAAPPPAAATPPAAAATPAAATPAAPRANNDEADRVLFGMQNSPVGPENINLVV